MQGVPQQFSSGLLIATRSGVQLFNLSAGGSLDYIPSVASLKVGRGFYTVKWTCDGVEWGRRDNSDLRFGPVCLSDRARESQQGMVAAGLGLHQAAFIGNELIVLDWSSLRSVNSGLSLALPSNLKSLGRVGNSSFVVQPIR